MTTNEPSAVERTLSDLARDGVITTEQATAQLAKYTDDVAHALGFWNRCEIEANWLDSLTLFGAVAKRVKEHKQS
jgi:hypothetical protein